MDYYKVLLTSLPGKGKTYSLRNLDPATTGVINVENKPLPFQNSFKNYFIPETGKGPTYQQAYEALVEMAKNPKITSIAFDSFSAYMESVLLHARKTKRNYDIWNMYNEEAGKILDMIKRVPKHVFVTAHYDYVGVEGDQERRVKIKGNEWAGMVEKEFTVVLYVDRKLVEKDGKKKVEAWFDAALDNSSSKCPPHLLPDGEFRVPNDAQSLLSQIEEMSKSGVVTV